MTNFFAYLGVVSFTITLLGIVAYLQRRRENRLIKKAQQDTLNDLTTKGMLKRQGEVGLVIRHVDNSEIVDEFIKSFNDAYTKTAYCSEFHDGEVKLWFKIEDVKIAEKIKKQLEEAGFYVA